MEPLRQVTLRTDPRRNGPFTSPCSHRVPPHVNTTLVLSRMQTLPPTHGSCGLASSLHPAALPPPLVVSGGSTELFGASVKVLSF